MVYTINKIFGGTLTGCGETEKSEDKAAMEIADFKPVPGMDGVVYNLDTKVMYYMFSTYRSGSYYGYGYFGVYLNENFKPCRYINGEIVEKED